MVRQATVVSGIITLLLVHPPTVGERTRTPESRILSFIHTVHSAQKTHQLIAGYYESLDCLASAACLQPLRVSTPHYLLNPSEIASFGDRDGYRLVFFPGPRANRPAVSPSRTPLAGFAIVAVPIRASETTPRALCSDASGGIYATPGDRVPAVEEGRCSNRSNVVFNPSQ